MSRPTIVTVDDDAAVSAAIVRDLSAQYGADYRVIGVTSGTEALDVLARLALRDDQVALIAADQRMPRIDRPSCSPRPGPTPRTPNCCC